MSMKLWATKGNQANGDCHLALLNGHTFIVPADPAGILVPDRFVKEALSRGCLPVGSVPDESETPSPDRAAIISGKMRDMMNSDDERYFTKEGKPNLNVVSKLCGFGVDRVECDKLWAAIVEDIDSHQAGQ